MSTSAVEFLQQHAFSLDETISEQEVGSYNSSQQCFCYVKHRTYDKSVMSIMLLTTDKCKCCCRSCFHFKFCMTSSSVVLVDYDYLPHLTSYAKKKIVKSMNASFCVLFFFFFFFFELSYLEIHVHMSCTKRICRTSFINRYHKISNKFHFFSL